MQYVRRTARVATAGLLETSHGRYRQVLFRSGALFDGHALRRARLAAGARRPDRRGGVRTRGRRAADRRRRPGRRPRRRPAGARLRGRPRARGAGRARADPLRPVTTLDSRGRTSTRSRRTPTRTPSCPGSSAAAGRWRPSRAARRPRPTSTRSCPDRPVFLPNRDHHGAWVNTPRARAGRHRRGHPGPGRRPLRARRRRRPERHAARGRDARRGPARCRPTADDGVRRRAARRPGATCTRSASPAGRTRSSGRTPAWTTPAPTYLRAVERGRPDRGRRRRALVGPRPRRRAGRRPRRRGARPGPTAGSARRASRSCRTASPRTAPPRSRRRTSTAAGTRPPTPATRSSTPDALREAVAALDARGLPGARARDRRPRRARGARRLRGRPTAGPDLRHHVAHLQLVHPDDVARFAALGVAANVQALWACHDDADGRADPAVRSGPSGPRWQYPFGDLRRAGARLVAGSDWPVSTPDPLAAIHVAVNRTTYGDPGRAGTTRSCPSRPWTSRPRSRRTPRARRG